MTVATIARLPDDILVNIYSSKQALTQISVHIFPTCPQDAALLPSAMNLSLEVEKRYSELYKQHLENVTKI